MARQSLIRNSGEGGFTELWHARRAGTGASPDGRRSAKIAAYCGRTVMLCILLPAGAPSG